MLIIPRVHPEGGLFPPSASKSNWPFPASQGKRFCIWKCFQKWSWDPSSSHHSRPKVGPQLGSPSSYPEIELKRNGHIQICLSQLLVSDPSVWVPWMLPPRKTQAWKPGNFISTQIQIAELIAAELPWRSLTCHRWAGDREASACSWALDDRGAGG